MPYKDQERRREHNRDYMRRRRLESPEFREMERRYQIEHSEKGLERTRRWRARHIEEARRRNRESKHRRWAERPRLRSSLPAEKLAKLRTYDREWQRQYWAANSEELRERKRKKRADDPDKQRNQERKYRRENPAVGAAKDHNRRARKRGAPGSHTGRDIQDLLTRQNGKCLLCHGTLRKSGKSKYHLDHVIPLALGGSNDSGNLQLLCPPCNLKKNARHPDEVAKEMGLLFL